MRIIWMGNSSLHWLSYCDWILTVFGTKGFFFSSFCSQVGSEVEERQHFIHKWKILRWKTAQKPTCVWHFIRTMNQPQPSNLKSLDCRRKPTLKEPQLDVALFIVASWDRKTHHHLRKNCFLLIRVIKIGCWRDRTLGSCGCWEGISSLQILTKRFTKHYKRSSCKS